MSADKNGAIASSSFFLKQSEFYSPFEDDKQFIRDKRDMPMIK